MRTFILGDTHGNHELAKRALIAAGAVLHDEPTDHISKRMGITIVHVGDLINGTRGTIQQDIKSLKNAHWYDCVIVGNHELPYWANDPKWTFDGFVWDDEVEKELDHQRWRFRPTKFVGDILITHAGLSREYEGIWDDPATASTRINKIWQSNNRDRLFTGIGRSRNGYDRYGGITWSDWSEAKARDFSQIFGHTSGKKIRVRESTTKNTRQICIDIGGKHGKAVGGIWVEHYPASDKKPTLTFPFIYEGGIDGPIVYHEHVWKKRENQYGGFVCYCGDVSGCKHPTCECTPEQTCRGVKLVQEVTA